MNDLKVCIRCHETKPVTDFYMDKRRGRRMGACRRCHMKSTTSWARRHPTKVREVLRNYRDRNRDAMRARDRQINKDDPQRRARVRKKHYDANRALILARQKEYREANRTLLRLLQARQRRADPERASAKDSRNNARRRVALGSAGHDLAGEEWRRIKEEFGYACAYCLRRGVRLTQDHMEPLSRGGRHTAWNVVPACQSCNSRKRARSLLSFLVGGRRSA